MDKSLIIGAAIVDIMLNIEALPTSGADIMASNERIEIGGCALNIANILKAYNVDFDFFAPVGQGKNAKLICEALSDEGIETLVTTNLGDNGHCLTLIEESGERTFITLPGIECEFQAEWFENINASDYSRAYVSGYEIEGNGGENIIEFLKANKHLEVFFAPGPRITYIQEEKMNELFSISPVVHLNKEEILTFTKEKDVYEAMKLLYEKTNAQIIVTCGNEATLIYDGTEIISTPVEPVTVVDTSGAGDAHLGGIIAGRMLGQTVLEAVAFANKIAGSVVQTKGPTYRR